MSHAHEPAPSDGAFPFPRHDALLMLMKDHEATPCD